MYGRLGPFHGTAFPDWLDDMISGESKSGDDLIPMWMRDAVNQAIEGERNFSTHGDGRQRIPITVLHQNKDSYDNDIVMIRSDVFREFILPAMFALWKVMGMSWDADKKTYGVGELPGWVRSRRDA
jgi:hypothetical protein